MAIRRTPPQTATRTETLADLLERILDKGIVIAGDIKVSLVNVELLTIQIRLVICSVERAQEMGMDWWANTPALTGKERQDQLADTLDRIENRLDRLEKLEQSEKVDKASKK